MIFVFVSMLVFSVCAVFVDKQKINQPHCILYFIFLDDLFCWPYISEFPYESFFDESCCFRSSISLIKARTSTLPLGVHDKGDRDVESN